jgi:hypothetical protein
MFPVQRVKKRWWIAVLLGGIIIAILVIRAITLPKATRGITDEAAMKAAVLQAVPIGSTLAHAEQFMVQEGFHCVPTTNADVAEQDRVYHHKDYLYCDRIDSAGFPVTQRWQMALVYEDEHIADVLVSTGLIGP